MSENETRFQKFMKRIGYAKIPRPAPRVGGFAEDEKKGEQKAQETKSFYFGKFGTNGRPRYEQATGVYFDPDEMRQLARTHFAATAIEHIVKDVQAAPWRIEYINPTEGKDSNQLDTISSFFHEPNKNGERFKTILAKLTQDILTLDAGCLVNVYSKNNPNKILEVYAKDGGRIYKEIDKFGYLGNQQKVTYETPSGKKTRELNVAYWQHIMHGHGTTIPFEQHEVSYMMANPLTDTPYGLAPTEMVKLIIQTLTRQEISTEEYYRKGEVAKTIMGIDTESEGLQDNIWDRFVDRFKTMIRRNPHNIIPVDQKVTLNKLGFTRKEFGYVETREDYRKAVFAAYGVTDAEMGYTKDITKGMETSQRQIYVRKGLFPILKLIEWHINMDVVGEFYKDGAMFGGKVPLVHFKFDLIDEITERQMLDMSQIKLDAGLMTINEVRVEGGMGKVPWGDINPLAMKSIQQFAQSVYFGALSPEAFAYIVNMPAHLPLPEMVPNIQDKLQDLGEKTEKYDDQSVTDEEIFKNWKKRKWHS